MTEVHGTSHNLMEEDPATITSHIANFIATTNESRPGPAARTDISNGVGKVRFMPLQRTLSTGLEPNEQPPFFY